MSCEEIQKIAYCGFLKRECLRSIEIPSTIAEIGDVAFFYGCSFLEMGSL